MLERLALIAALWAPAAGLAECVALGHAKGTPVPEYTLLSHEELQPHWERYSARYGSEARVAYLAEEYRLGPLREQCLVQVERRGRASNPGFSGTLVLYSPCSSLEAGRSYRLTLVNYCVEQFGQEAPDFYTALGYTHAYIENRDVY